MFAGKTEGGCMKTIIVNEEVRKGLMEIRCSCMGWRNREWVRSFCDNIYKQETMTYNQFKAYRGLLRKAENQYKLPSRSYSGRSRELSTNDGWGYLGELADYGSGYYDC